MRNERDNQRRAILNLVPLQAGSTLLFLPPLCVLRRYLYPRRRNAVTEVYC